MSQFTRLTDGRTDGQTDGGTEFSSQDRVCIPCSAVKTLSASALLHGMVSRRRTMVSTPLEEKADAQTRVLVGAHSCFDVSAQKFALCACLHAHCIWTSPAFDPLPIKNHFESWGGHHRCWEGSQNPSGCVPMVTDSYRYYPRQLCKILIDSASFMFRMSYYRHLFNAVSLSMSER